MLCEVDLSSLFPNGVPWDGIVEFQEDMLDADAEDSGSDEEEPADALACRCQRIVKKVFKI